MQNIILTGIPRGGTTLAAALIDKAPNSACFSEPAICLELQERCPDAGSFADGMVDLFDRMRLTLGSGGSIMDRRSPDGDVVTNYFSSAQSGTDRKQNYREIPRSIASISEDFVLGIKHNGLFSSALKELRDRPNLRVICLVRNPVPVLRSWDSLDLPVREGRLPSAEKYWPELLNESVSVGRSQLQRQLDLYLALVERYVMSGSKIFRYEDIVRNPSIFVTAITGYSDRTDYSEVQNSRPVKDEAIETWLRQELNVHPKRQAVEAFRSLYPDFGA